MAQVRFFNSTLSASEVSDLYTEPAASNNTLNYPASAGCIAAYPLQTDAVDLSGNYSGASSNVTFGQPGYLTGNTDGTIPSTVAANPETGFSIVKYIGNATAGATVGHGLSSTIEFIITKNTSNSSENWNCWHIGLSGNGYRIVLNSTGAEDGTSPTVWNNNINPTSTTFTIGSGASTNGSSNAIIAYCFTSIPGYSRVGSYVGTGGALSIYIVDLNLLGFYLNQ